MADAVKTYRKKPVEIQAMELTKENREEVAAWCGGHFEPDVVYRMAGIIPDGSLDIPTLEGVMAAKVGDFVIRGVKGEFYPCKPDIFAATYEEV